MAHFSRLYAISIDVPGADHDATVAFWSGALGAPLEQVGQYPEFSGAKLPDHDMIVLAQRLGDGPARVHLDFHTDDVDAEVARLERLGATRLERAGNWQVMRDPAGLVFCVVLDRPGVLTEANATRWD
ncbi:VOC family protein [Dactylosporangium matsuzakiense]|uniref:VOC family protein n=1 Tax=Dactylosporangium matsuzakiense TaxID=53360 RepID=UPI0021C454D9|nr:VOC family protein [Dactylosporangium matsuzakiense]UWZ47472.1 glyoxalase/bleomycin resistance/dioxygenase family protein [Dactylosporangium matsuzakiense]